MIIGTAFGKIVSSLVGDVIMPLLGALLNTVDFTKLSYSLHSVSGNEVIVNYGKFLQSSFDFVIVALAIFVFISLINKAIKKPAKDTTPPTPALAPDVVLLMEIRDALTGKKPVVAKEVPKTIAKKKAKK